MSQPPAVAPPTLLMDELLGATMHAIPLPVFVADAAGRVLYANREFEQLVGQSRAELQGQSRDTLLMDGWGSHGSLLEVGSDTPVPMYDTEGSLRWFNVRTSALPAGGGREFSVYVFSDITDRHLAQAQLSERTQLFEHMLAATHDGVWDWNLGTNSLTGNDRVLGMLGYASGEFESSMRTMQKLAHDLDWQHATERMDAHLQHGTPYAVTVRYRHADGGWRWILCRAHAVRDTSGQAYRVVGTHTDITDRKETELALQRATRSAEEAARAKADFLANMSHEIRTPMTAILGFTDLLTDPDLSEAERAEFVETIRRNGDHLLRMINDILDLSKIDAGKLDVESIRWDPAQLVEEVASLMRVRAVEKGLGLHVRIDHDVPQTMLGDPTRTRQILMNLVGNAIKFTREGSVLVRVCADLSALEGQPRLLFDVIDTGIGIPEHKLQQIFGSFDQADTSTTRTFGGTGLGLMISRRLSELMGGAIEVQSTVDVGSMFSLVLPVRGATTRPITAPFERVGTPPAAQAEPVVRRILLAEDGVDNQRLIGVLLQRAGFEPTVVENGQLACDEALAAAAAGTPFDAILMDMQMPVCDGYTATRRLRAAGYRNPIIALTAHAMSGDRERCLAAGCDDFETKPVRPARLQDVLDRTIAAFEAASDPE